MSHPHYKNEKEMKSYLKALVEDAEQLLGETEKDTREHVRTTREKLKLNVASMKYRIHLIEESIREKARQADRYVHENPWKSMGVASLTTLGIGLIVGFFFGRESNN